MVDTARYPSRRTIVKAGLWAAPAVAVVNLTSMSAAHASACARTIYPSHGILVYTDPSTGPNTYYVFKFGDTSTSPPTAVAGFEQNPGDIVFLQLEYPNKTLILNDKASPTWTALQRTIMVALYASGANTGFVFTGPTTNLVAAFVFSGNTGYLPVLGNGSGQFIFTKCA